IALFRVLRTASDRYLLRLPRDTAGLLCDHLNRYRVFFPCEMRVLSESQIWGVFHPGEAGLPAHEHLWRIPVEQARVERQEYWLEARDERLEEALATGPCCSADAWWR
ncbi:hypothetical protein RZS08_34585, partial [Arthrospira platensis SPKY1]|nr:hypothetical protein [Arthrospira platensis SPKY1]